MLNSIKMKNKKSAVAVQTLITLALLALVFLILVTIYFKFIRSETSEVSDSLKATGDYDGDNVANLFDKCKCTRAFTSNGCPDREDPELESHDPCGTCREEIKEELC
jgi:uncharacterized membrane protein YvbJ